MGVACWYKEFERVADSATNESSEGLGYRAQSDRIWKSGERTHERRVSGTCIIVSMNKGSLFSAGYFDDKVIVVATAVLIAYVLRLT